MHGLTHSLTHSLTHGLTHGLTLMKINGFREDSPMKQIPLIEIRGGSPYEMGFQYGKQAKELILSGLAHYKRRFSATNQMSLEEIYRYSMSFLPVVEQTFPDIAMEARGIAQGAGVKIDDIMMLNCRYEISKFPKTNECTTFAVMPQAVKSGGTLFGQNWDYCLGILDNVVMIHSIYDDGSRVLGIAEAGQMIRHGINSHGIGLVMNGLFSHEDNKGNGNEIPTCFLRKKILSAKSFDEARANIFSSARSVSCNYVLVSKEGIAADFEAYPSGVNQILPQNGILTHANHFIIKPELSTVEKSMRDTQLRTLLMTHYGEIDPDYIKSCLGDHTNYPQCLCHHPEDPAVELELREITVAGEIYNFDDGTAHICAGPPCAGHFTTFVL